MATQTSVLLRNYVGKRNDPEAIIDTRSFQKFLPKSPHTNPYSTSRLQSRKNQGNPLGAVVVAGVSSDAAGVTERREINLSV